MREVILVGLNHRTAPVEIREQIAFPQKGLEKYLKELSALPSIAEGVILSTCNRVEIYAAARDTLKGAEEIKGFICEGRPLHLSSLESSLYVLQGEESVRHIFRVAASLDSMVIGEPQILGQIKEAYRRAHAVGTTGTVLNRLFHKAFSVAKRVRTETGIGDGAVSVSFVAVELAKRIFATLQGKQVLIIGAGEMCELAAQHLVRAGVERVLVTNRTWARAMELAERFCGEAIPFEDLRQALLRVDIVISSTGAPGFIINRNEVSEIIRKRRNSPLFFIDIAVPRDIDPEVNKIDNVYVYDIDDLQEIARGNVKERLHEAQRAEAIVQVEVEKFCRWYRSLDVVPTIVALLERAEKVRQREVAKTLASLSHLSVKDREAVEVLTRAIIKKILHGPIAYLKGKGFDVEGEEAVDIVKRIFRLDED